MKQYTCIVCPNSCLISVEDKEGKLSVSGNQCKRGEEFAINEHTHPMRMFTSTVKIKGASIPRISVVSTAEIPKEMMAKAQHEMSKVALEAPVRLGDIVVKNVCGLEADIVASRTLKKIDQGE